MLKKKYYLLTLFFALLAFSLSAQDLGPTPVITSTQGLHAGTVVYETPIYDVETRRDIARLSDFEAELRTSYELMPGIESFEFDFTGFLPMVRMEINSGIPVEQVLDYFERFNPFAVSIN